MKADDGFGPALCEALEPEQNKNFKVLDGGELPENMISTIREYEPDAVIIADAADFGGKVGELKLIDVAEINNPALSTHSLPLSVLVKFLQDDMDGELEVFFLGAQIQDIDFDMDMSPEVHEAVAKAKDIILKAVAK
ncbi:hydrogenase 3 maturation protease [Parelusimicrobium proximum]